MADFFMKKACAHCPFRKDVKPFLTAERGEELAAAATNPYNSFTCHKTTVSDEDFGGDGSEMVVTENSLECAGFLTLQINEGAYIPEGFTPDPNAYADVWDMVDAYQNQD